MNLAIRTKCTLGLPVQKKAPLLLQFERRLSASDIIKHVPLFHYPEILIAVQHFRKRINNLFFEKHLFMNIFKLSVWNITLNCKNLLTTSDLCRIRAIGCKSAMVVKVLFYTNSVKWQTNKMAISPPTHSPRT